MGFILTYWTPISGWKFVKKWPFFRADMAGLGKYGTGGYGRIGVYRVKEHQCRPVTKSPCRMLN